MEAVVTWKLTPGEARRIRDTLELAKSEALEMEREIRGENPRQASQYRQHVTELTHILEKI